MSKGVLAFPVAKSQMILDALTLGEHRQSSGNCSVSKPDGPRVRRLCMCRGLRVCRGVSCVLPGVGV